MIPVERLRELLYLDEEGVLRWKVARGRRTRVGDEAGTTVSQTGYRRIKVEQHDLLTHRVIFAVHHGRWPAKQVDHRNGDRADNRVENLREATPVQNGHNRKPTGPLQGCRQRYNGKWEARLSTRGHNRYLGLFDTAEEASEACRVAAEERYGEYAMHLSRAEGEKEGRQLPVGVTPYARAIAEEEMR